MAQHKSTTELLAENLRALMRRDDLSMTSLAAKAGVDKNTIRNMLERSNAAQIDTVETVAQAFGLRAWQLLIENSDQTKLLQAYAKTDDTGRQNILSVAEMAARPYNSSGPT